MIHLVANTWCEAHKGKFEALVQLAREVGWSAIPSELWPTEEELGCPDCTLVRAKGLGMSREQYAGYVEEQARDLADEIFEAWEDDA